MYATTTSSAGNLDQTEMPRLFLLVVEHGDGFSVRLTHFTRSASRYTKSDEIIPEYFCEGNLSLLNKHAAKYKRDDKKKGTETYHKRIFYHCCVI